MNLRILYGGHLGTPNGRWWPDRQNLSDAVREFEAESVSYLVCARLGIETASNQYLGAYVRKFLVTPPISLDRVIKSVWLLEQMGRVRLGLRKKKQPEMPFENWNFAEIASGCI